MLVPAYGNRNRRFVGNGLTCDEKPSQAEQDKPWPGGSRALRLISLRRHEVVLRSRQFTLQRSQNQIIGRGRRLSSSSVAERLRLLQLSAS
jgi:hypothetical protein